MTAVVIQVKVKTFFFFIIIDIRGGKSPFIKPVLTALLCIGISMRMFVGGYEVLVAFI